jgi:hypothetical protein
MKLKEYGKVLFIDDKYKSFSQVISSFAKNGIQVQYWKGEGDLPRNVYNIRVVITDLDLTDTDMKKALGDSFYFPIVDALKKIPGPFMVIIVAREFERSDPIQLKRVYEDKTGMPFPGFIAKRGLKKGKLTPARLERLINTLLPKNDILDLILTWEEIFDKAKDSALCEITSGNTKNAVQSLVKILCYNSHENTGAARSFIDEMSRLVSRQSGQEEDCQTLSYKIKIINDKLPSKKIFKLTKEDHLLLSKLIFYKPLKNEGVTTGDIYATTERFKYAVILTPRCDIAQAKTNQFLVCYAFPIRKLYFRNKQYPPHKIDPAIQKLHVQKVPLSQIAKSIEKKYLKEPSDSLPILWNFSDKEIGLCLDFNNVMSVSKDTIKTWNRIIRADSPYIEEILHRYGNKVSRIGTLEINRSPSQIQNFLEKIK